ncbi:hypothetical protein [Mycolicibacterium hodleri]|nr:hypothetical protein [Mycolicibacterium hodleri]
MTSPEPTNDVDELVATPATPGAAALPSTPTDEEQEDESSSRDDALS